MKARSISRVHGPVLAFFTLLFFLRVLGQALVVFFSVSWLPSTEHWASGLIPYPTLLAIQLVMLIGMVKIVSDIWRGKGFFAQTRIRLVAISRQLQRDLWGQYGCCATL